MDPLGQPQSQPRNDLGSYTGTISELGQLTRALPFPSLPTTPPTPLIDSMGRAEEIRRILQRVDPSLATRLTGVLSKVDTSYITLRRPIDDIKSTPTPPPLLTEMRRHANEWTERCGVVPIRTHKVPIRTFRDGPFTAAVLHHPVAPAAALRSPPPRLSSSCSSSSLVGGNGTSLDVLPTQPSDLGPQNSTLTPPPPSLSPTSSIEIEIEEPNDASSTQLVEHSPTRTEPALKGDKVNSRSVPAVQGQPSSAAAYHPPSAPASVECEPATLGLSAPSFDEPVVPATNGSEPCVKGRAGTKDDDTKPSPAELEVTQEGKQCVYCGSPSSDSGSRANPPHAYCSSCSYSTRKIGSPLVSADPVGPSASLKASSNRSGGNSPTSRIRPRLASPPRLSPATAPRTPTASLTQSYGDRLTILMEELGLNSCGDSVSPLDTPSPEKRAQRVFSCAATLEKLDREIAKGCVSAKFASLPIELVRRLLSLLHAHVSQHARHTLELPKGATPPEAICVVLNGFVAAGTILSILTVDGISKELVLEELVEDVVAFLKFHVIHHVFAPYRNAEDARKSGPDSRVIVNVASKACGLIDQLCPLLSREKLTDSLILDITSCCLPAFFIQGLGSMQLSALPVLCLIFYRYPDHRDVILDEIFQSLTKMPKAVRTRRTFGLLDGSKDVLMVTALVLQLIQSCISTTKGHSLDGQATVYARAVEYVGGENAFLSRFILRCSEHTDEEDDYRPMLETFTQDLLVMYRLPEWPAAGLMLQVLGSSLVTNLAHPSEKLRLLSLGLIGDICKSLRSLQLHAPECLDSILPKIVKAKEGEEDSSCICKGGWGNGNLWMISCDGCGDWFHGECVGLGKSALGEGQSWMCSSCALRKQVDTQLSEAFALAGTPEDSFVAKLTFEAIVDEEEARELMAVRQLIVGHLCVLARQDPSVRYARNFLLAKWAEEEDQNRSIQNDSSMAGVDKDLSMEEEGETSQGDIFEHDGKICFTCYDGGAAREAYLHSKTKRKCPSCNAPLLANAAKEEELQLRREATEMKLPDSSLIESLTDLSQTPLSAEGAGEQSSSQGDPRLYSSQLREALHSTSRPPPARSASFSRDMTKAPADYALVREIYGYLVRRDQLCANFDNIFNGVLASFRDKDARVRNKAMKALTKVVEADPSILANPHVHRAVTTRLDDASILVREAVVKLVGSYMTSKPELAEQYYELIATRIRDKGVSVRKCVVDILKDLCLSHSKNEVVAKACKTLVLGINDTKKIRKRVVEAFQELWFSPNHTKGATGLLSAETARSLQTCVKAEQIMLVLDPRKPNTWLAELTQKLMRNDGKRGLTTTFDVCEDICGTIMTKLDEIQDGPLSLSDQAAERLPCLTALSFFCDVHPSLLLAHVGRLREHLEPQTRRRPRTKEEEKRISVDMDISLRGLRAVVSIFASTVELLPAPDSGYFAFLNPVREKLAEIIKSTPLGVLSCATKCLCSVATVTGCAQPAERLLLVFVTELEKQLSMLSDRTKVKEAVICRLLYCAGEFCRYLQWDSTCQSTKQEQIGRVYSLCVDFLGVRGDGVSTSERVKTSAIAALANVFISTPTLWMSKGGSNLVDWALRCRFPKVKLKMITGFSEYLRVQDAAVSEKQKGDAKAGVNSEDRVKSEVSSRSTEVSEQSEEPDRRPPGSPSPTCRVDITGILNEVAQRHLPQILEVAVTEAPRTLPRGMDPDAPEARAAAVLARSIRREALTAVSLVLSQGLLHPISAISRLICLTTDQDTHISDRALSLLEKCDKKEPKLLNARLIDGVGQVYAFQKRCCPLVQAVLNPEDPKSCSSVLAKAYSLFSANRTKQHTFLESVLEVLRDESPKEAADMHAAEMTFFARSLAALPFQDTLDEPLFIVCLVNRTINLRGEPLLTEMKPLLGKSAAASRTTGAGSGEEGEAASMLSPNSESGCFERERELAWRACRVMTLLALKRTLKQLYGLTDEDCKSYAPQQPLAPAKKGRAPVSLDVVTKEGSPFSTLPEHLPNDFAGLRDMYLKLKKQMQEDSMDFDPTASPRKSAKRRASRARGGRSNGKRSKTGSPLKRASGVRTPRGSPTKKARRRSKPRDDDEYVP